MDGIVKGLGNSRSDSWCTYMEGTRAESKLHSRNSKKISRGGTDEP